MGNATAAARKFNTPAIVFEQFEQANEYNENATRFYSCLPTKNKNGAVQPWLKMAYPKNKMQGGIHSLTHPFRVGHFHQPPLEAAKVWA